MLLPVIIKRKKIVAGGGHHGGAWKVAYADFVTAMMAFFLLMWILGATDADQRKLYDLIYKRTIASQMAAARLERTSVDIASEDEQVILDVQEDNTYEEKPKAPQRMPAARPPPLPKNEAPKPLKVNNPFGVPEQKLENVSLDSPAKVPNGSGPFADDPPLLEGKFLFCLFFIILFF